MKWSGNLAAYFIFQESQILSFPTSFSIIYKCKISYGQNQILLWSFYGSAQPGWLLRWSRAFPSTSHGFKDYRLEKWWCSHIFTLKITRRKQALTWTYWIHCTVVVVMMSSSNNHTVVMTRSNKYVIDHIDYFLPQKVNFYFSKLNSSFLFCDFMNKN